MRIFSRRGAAGIDIKFPDIHMGHTYCLGISYLYRQDGRLASLCFQSATLDGWEEVDSEFLESAIKKTGKIGITPGLYWQLKDSKTSEE